MLRVYTGPRNSVSPAHAKVLETFGDVAQTCREAKAKRAQPENLDIILERATLSSRLIHQNRVYDQAYAKVKLAQDTFFKFPQYRLKFLKRMIAPSTMRSTTSEPWRHSIKEPLKRLAILSQPLNLR
jgi:hypothetical protein